jgi:putative ABC transport system ATP-binding protein
VPTLTEVPPALLVPSPAVIADRLAVTYDGVSGHQIHALDEVTISLESAGWTAIMGPSGSGKSTLLHVIGGLQRPSRGAITVCGRRLDQLSNAQLAQFRLATIGFVFQAFHLLAFLEAWENVALPLIAARVPPAQRRSRALQALDDVGLAERAHHRPGELSGGEQQRVALARAMVNGPNILIADEPTGNLDAASALLVLDVLSECVRRGTTVVCATHDATIASRANHQVHLNHGLLSSGNG